MAAGGTSSDALDRALRFREEGLFRIKLDELGGHHMHEVAWSCILGVRANRYKQVEELGWRSGRFDRVRV